MRQRGRFAGFSLYVSNTTDRHDGYLCYKDGPELPPLDFNTNCITNGRYVIFYNERLGGTKYPLSYMTGLVFTELCEVTVTGTVFIGGRGVFQFFFYILMIFNKGQDVKSSLQKDSIFDTMTLNWVFMKP